MKQVYRLVFLMVFYIANLPGAYSQNSVSFSSSKLSGVAFSNPTSLQFGPDGRLYVSQANGTIYAYTIQKNGLNDYEVVATETIQLIKNIPNHNDNGELNSSITTRQVTGILVTGTASNPVLFVGSSDPRIGGGGTGGDLNLDTNSGIVSKLTWNGSAWVKVDVVIGLPRSEENHAVNGMQLDEVNNILYLAVGGHTNAGAPSNNFAFLTEYALSAAILEIDLNMIQNQFGGSYVLPTLDDPTRPNTGPNGEDTNDPFGGNDGLNQAKLVPGGPVQIYSSGYRNAYDLVITKTMGKEGRIYTIDNGANGGWGGHPDQEGASGDPLVTNVTNNYVAGEPGSTTPGPNDSEVNNLDNLHLVSKPGMNPIYAGHPSPIRANPAGAGLYWFDNETGIAHFELTPTTDWPPVPLALANPVEGDFRNPGVNDGALYTWGASTNGLAEFTSNKFFNGSMEGDLITASFDGNIYRIKLSADGTSVEFVESLASGFGSIPLDVIAQGTGQLFEGTIWSANFGSSDITIFEPEGTWQEVLSVDSSFPIARHEASFIELGGKLYLIGGRETTTMNIYDPALKVWTAGAKLPFIMHHFQAVTWNGKIYILGAYKGFYSNGNIDNSESPVENIFIYDPELDTWTEAAAIPRPRGSAGTVVYNDEFYLVGGIVNGHEDGWVNWVDKYDPVSNTWEELADAPRERDHFHAVEINGKIYLTGGRKTNASGDVFGETIAEIDVYNIASNSWQTLPESSNVPTKRAGASSVVFNGEIYLIGGESQAQTLAHNECEIFNPVSETWRTGPNLVTGRHGTGADVYDQTIYTVAGSANKGSGPLLYSMEAFSSATTCSGEDMNYNLDDDEDCFSNADETLNGTNPCSPSSKPNDFDGDCLSDLIDTDDDNDGIPDTGDPFAWDASNGMSTTIPLFYPLLNADPGFGFFGLGFTGLMTNTTTDYLDLFDPQNQDLIMGGAVGIASVPANSGDAKTNNQEYAFQFGFKINPDHGVITIRAKLQGTPFFDGIALNDLQNQSQGIFIGNGDQDNYLKLALSANNGNPGIMIYGENLGAEFINDFYPVVDILTTGILYLTIEINPATSHAIMFYQTGTDENKIGVGPPLVLPSAFTNLLAGNAAMAIGLIASSGTAPDFSASWDFINVTTTVPFINEDAPSFYNRFVGNPTPGFTLDLDQIFNDDLGVENLTYEIVSVEANSFIDTYSLTDAILNIDFISNVVGSAKIVVKATDGDGLFIEYQFQMQVIPSASPFLRINAGGNSYGTWSADNYYTGGNLFSRVTAIANTTDDVLYQTERYDEEILYEIPVPRTGYYGVNLHFAEIYHGISNSNGIGDRVFDVEVEGELKRDDYDIFKEAGGAAIAIVENIDSVFVVDGLLTLRITAVVDNAKISAIELLEYSLDPIPNSPPLVENPGDRYIYEGQSLDIQIIASDINFGDVLTYSAVGLPASLSINPTTGLISGTIEASENDFQVVVSVSDGKGAITQVTFIIKVVEPLNYHHRINAGGSAQVFDAEVWSADYYFLDGKTYTNSVDILNTIKDAIYQSERYGPNINYEIPVPGPGNYNITLHFAEIFWAEAGKRIFNVNVENGQASISQFDIFVEAGGSNLAISKSFSVNVTDGYLSILFTSLTDQAKISGIELTACIDPVVASFTPSSSSICLGSSAVLTVNGSLGDATAWYLYESSCEGTPIASNATGIFEVSPTENTTYYVRGEGGCITGGPCTSVNVQVNTVNTAVSLSGYTLTAEANGATYQWINCAGNTNIAGATNKTFTPEATGSYAVRVTQNGCTEVSSCTSLVIVGIPENLSEKVSVYPNPVSTILTIELPVSSANVAIEITDGSGRAAMRGFLDYGNKIELDTRSLSPGVYVLHIRASEILKTVKLIVR